MKERSEALSYLWNSAALALPLRFVDSGFGHSTLVLCFSKKAKKKNKNKKNKAITLKTEPGSDLILLLHEDFYKVL